MFFDVLKGFLIGICASIPIGPIALLIMQKSLNEGHRAGFRIGMAACVVDVVFATVAIFALAVAQRVLDENEVPILITGGLIVTAVGSTMAFGNPFRHMRKEVSRIRPIRDFIQAVLMGVSNPGAIFVIFALFAFFGIDVEHHDFTVAPVILAVGAGTALYWFVFSWFFSHLSRRIKLSTILRINRISGIVVLVVGIALLSEGLMKWIFIHG